MNSVNLVLLNAVANSGTVNSAKVDAEFLTQVSAQVSFTDGAAAGAIKFQASNDHCAAGNVAADFTPTNWSDISGPGTVVAGALTLIPAFIISYRWIRLTWTSTGGAGTLTATIDGKKLS